MRLVRRMSLLLALALVLTVGGVYAAWNYADGNATESIITATGNMADVVVGDAKGVINVNSNTLSFVVDDAGDFVAELEVTGEVVLSFTPAAQAEGDVASAGIALVATVTVVGDQNKYPDDADGVAILAPSASATIVLNDGNKLAPSSTCTISAADIAAALVFCEGEDVVLDSLEENEAFEAKLGSYVVTIKIDEYIP